MRSNRYRVVRLLHRLRQAKLQRSQELVASGSASNASAKTPAKRYKKGWRASAGQPLPPDRATEFGPMSAAVVIADSYCLAIAMLMRSSGLIRWSCPSSPMSICTHLISPVNLFPDAP